MLVVTALRQVLRPFTVPTNFFITVIFCCAIVSAVILETDIIGLLHKLTETH